MAAAIGASGILLGMHAFRHKTRHRYADCRQTGEIHYGFTQFRHHYYQYAQQNKATMHIEHKLGYAVEVDWAGATLSDIDSSTGEIQKAYLFVGALPCSGYA